VVIGTFCSVRPTLLSVAPRSFLLDDALADYVAAHSEAPDPVYADITRETRDAFADAAGMQIAPDQAALLTLLTRLTGVDRAVEVGTFTGSSSVAIARGLRPGGRLVCFDVSEQFTDVARRAWARAGLDDRVELRLGPALPALQALPKEATIDLAFVDADKGGYPAYYEELVPRLRAGGLLIVDNTLWHGQVADPTADDPDTNAIRAVNDRAVQDERVETVLLTVADGILLCRRAEESGT
jgi:caffeoyl-CoA O-methyltransferase